MSPLTHPDCFAPKEITKILSHVEILIESHEVELSSEASTHPPSCNYTALSRKSRHNWSLEEREALCILRRWYCNSWKELGRIFNAYFTGKSQSDNIPEVTGSALSMQFLEMQRHRVKSQAFESVFIETLFADESRTWDAVRRDLEQSARAIGIPLIRKLYEDREELLKICEEVPKCLKRKKFTNCTDSVLGSFAYRSDGEESGPATPAKRSRYLTPSPTPQKGSKALTKVNSTQYDSGARKKQHKLTPATPQSLRRPSQHGIRSPKTDPQSKNCFGPEALPMDRDDISLGQFNQLPRPRIVFRFYDNNSSGVNTPTGMRAGLFQDSRLPLSPPPEIDTKAFRKEAIKHFSWTREPTPFISMCQSILPALHRGLLSSMDASIAVIDLHTVSRSQEWNHSKVYVAGHIIKRLGLRQEVYGYRGRSEWLVWGMIDKNAIITTFKVEALRRFLARSPDVSIVLHFTEIESSRNAKEYREKLKGNVNYVGRASGRVIGKFLACTGLPDSYVESAAKKISRDWQLHGNTSLPRLRAYLEGVQFGLHVTRAELEASTQAKGNQRIATYLEWVDSGLQRKGAIDGDLSLKQPGPKQRIMRYLQQVDAGMERKPAELTLSRRRNSRPCLASSQAVDLGLSRKEEGLTDKYEVPIRGQKLDDLLLRRRQIEAACQGR